MWQFSISDSKRHDRVQGIPQQKLGISNENYPKDDDLRHFSNFHYIRKLNNGEVQDRRWLGYSKPEGKVYCIPCRLFPVCKPI
ncbi:UNVERIFIED_CONTAM: hypothetical protein RMT77_003507 [Armadillidium vulgare]